MATISDHFAVWRELYLFNPWIYFLAFIEVIRFSSVFIILMGKLTIE